MGGQADSTPPPAELLDLLPCLVVSFDGDRRVVYANAAWRALTGHSPSSEVDDRWLDAFFPDDRAVVEHWIRIGISEERPVTREILMPTGLGVRLMRFAGRPHFDADGRLESYLLVADDITELAARTERLEDLVQHDELTGLATRREFWRQAERSAAEVAHTDRKAAVLLLDVDGFKAINDEHGHVFGDEVLRALARRLTEVVPSSALVARYGGDEFAVLILDAPTVPEIEGIGRRVLTSLSRSMNVRGKRLALSVSVGVEVSNDEHVATWLERADAALYKAKASGPGTMSTADDSIHGETPVTGRSRLAPVDRIGSTSGQARPARSGSPARFHAVHFYDGYDELLPALGGYVGAGLFQEAVLVVATAEHRRRLREQLDGDSLLAAKAEDRYCELDAEETMAQFMRNGLPDADLLRMVIATPLRRTIARHGRARVYGEMVGLLWEAGNKAAALMLEAMWNDLQRDNAFSLLCGYSKDGFSSTGEYGLNQVRACHTQLLAAG
jgi:diguanylate cyclase (GGDEF)-like protein/PAS domain S-box-containing protein